MVIDVKPQSQENIYESDVKRLLSRYRSAQSLKGMMSAQIRIDLVIYMMHFNIYY